RECVDDAAPSVEGADAAHDLRIGGDLLPLREQRLARGLSVPPLAGGRAEISEEEGDAWKPEVEIGAGGNELPAVWLAIIERQPERFLSIRERALDDAISSVAGHCQQLLRLRRRRARRVPVRGTRDAGIADADRLERIADNRHLPLQVGRRQGGDLPAGAGQ